MSTLSSHVLDTVLGVPAAGLATTLAGPAGEVLVTASTDSDGRVRFDLDLEAGVYRLVLGTGLWFAAAGRATLFPEVSLTFLVEPGEQHYHLAVLLGPFSFTAYRGS